MIAIPPAAIERCVEAGSPAAEHATTILEFAGAPAAVAPLLERARAAKMQVISDDMREGRRYVALRYGADISYRELGGLTYSIQLADLTPTSRFDPPICGTQDR